MFTDTVLDRIIDKMTFIVAEDRHPAPPRWTAEEDAFLEANLGWLSEAEIAERLGRSVNAVHLRWFRDLKLPAPSRHPDIVTANQVAAMLGVDGHSIIKLINRGLLPARTLPGDRNIRVIRRITLHRWVINPDHWPYFRPWQKTIPDPHLRRLVTLKMARWDDEWWTPGQVAEYHGLTSSNVINRRILNGDLPAIRWGNWWIKRSDALGQIFFVGKGSAGYVWSPRADAYLLAARAAGETWADIARKMKWTRQRVAYRWRYLQSQYKKEQTQ